MVKPPDLFAEKEVQSFFAHATGDFEAALQVSPEAFDAVRVYGATHIDASLMVDFLMWEEMYDACVPSPSIRVHLCPRSEMCRECCQERLALQVGYRERNDLLQGSGKHPEYDLFA